jgi:polyferredoxin
MNSLTLLHNFLTNTTNILNFLLSVELAVACLWGMWQGLTIGEATAGKIALLTAIAAIMFRLWQSWPQEWLSFTAVLPQCAFVVFAGGLVGCTFKWAFDRAVARN